MKIFSFFRFKQLLAITTTLFLAISVILSSSVSLQAKTAPKQEALVTAEFANPISSNTLKSKLKDEFAKEEINIMSLSSKVDIEGQKQTFTLANENQLDNNEFLKTYQKSYKAFLSTLTILKTKTDQKQTIENQENLKPLLNKYSKDNLEKNKQKQTKTTLNFDNIALSGSLKSLNKLKSNNLYGLAKSVDLTDLVKLQEQADDLKIKLEKVKTDTEKQDLINKTLQDSLGQNASATAPKLDLDQNQIQAVDKFVKKDIAGNSFVNSQDLKNLKLNPEQVSQVSQALNNYNKLPTELKDGSSQAMNEILQTPTFQNELQKQDSLVDKVAGIVIGGVNAEAFGCRRQVKTYRQWWGVQHHLNDCVVNDLYIAAGSVILIASILALTFCPIACGVIAAVVAWYAGYIAWLNAQCAGNGVMLNRRWDSLTWFWAVC